MSFQPLAEKEAERELIKSFVRSKGGRVVKLQEDQDDGKADGLVEFGGKTYPVEARRKGYPNHRGKSFNFHGGWDNRYIQEGIYLNERTIRGHENDNFIFLVEIKGEKPRYAILNKQRKTDLLNQPMEYSKSTNSGSRQSVKKVPADWFKE